jgi:hypothetical protein
MFDVFDQHGQPKTLAWLYDQFGALTTQSEVPTIDPPWKVIAVHDSGDPAPSNIGITCLNERGLPAVGLSVVFFWPDAPDLPGCGHHGRGVVGITNGGGYVGFAIGKGAYYDPRHNIGPHEAWIYGPNQSERLVGLGMIAGTDHRHLDVTFQLNPQPDPDPEPQPEPADIMEAWTQFPVTVADRLDAIAERLDRIAAALESGKAF